MKSFLDGKQAYAAPSLAAMPKGPLPQHAPTAPKAAHPHEAPGTSGSKAQVEIVKEGDKVVRIFVTCSCGERVEIECLYPAGS
jgi:hypothetical protein